MFSNVFRIGKDVEVRFTGKGDAVADLSVVYDRGYGDNKKSQWVKAVIFGKQAEALAPYLTKGKQVHLVLDDVGVDTYAKKDGTEGWQMVGKVVKVNLVGGKSDEAPAPRPASGGTRAPAPTSVADLIDDVPFNRLPNSYAI